jgi:sporulation protein YlmC with PRC-barrel domain
MTPRGPIKLVSELLDLPLLDSEGKYAGIVDDVEFSGRAGADLKLKALLVGPGAYRGRLPAVVMGIVTALVGDRVVRVPMNKVRTISHAVHLECPGRDLGLHKSEADARKFLPHRGAL